MKFPDSITSETTLEENGEVTRVEPSHGPTAQPNNEQPSMQTALSSRPVKRAYKRRVVCKARGLSKKHNADTAYFEIQANAPHGLLLSCSHPECVVSGRKFRYCQVCALPVAKRNFLLRHGHGLFQSSKELKEEVDEVSDSLLQEDHCQPCVETLKTEDGKPHHRRVVSFEGRRRQLEGQLCPDEHEWLRLLHQRPDVEDQPKMSEWMGKIMMISERMRAELKKATESNDMVKTMTVEAPHTKAPTIAQSRKNSTSLVSESAIQLADVATSVEVSGYSTLLDEVDIENLFNFEHSTGGVGLGIETATAQPTTYSA